MTDVITTIRQARERARKTRGEVALALGVSQRTVERWEAGHCMPPADSLMRLAKLFRRRPEDLVRVA